MISTWVWGRLPGNAWMKALILAVAFAAMVLVLFEWVFPYVSVHLPIQEQTVEGGA
ncbi:hypothetical protein [Demequina sp. NBRC 110052]|uniref:hypothetical protein n=1 Tax=Demequina sp. NBRC 110052 TaxID=1570341 RepID=UPI0013565288|nr:hypothetical protein [Demequina sp. NBRC 110052]